MMTTTMMTMKRRRRFKARDLAIATETRAVISETLKGKVDLRALRSRVLGELGGLQVTRGHHPAELAVAAAAAAAMPTERGIVLVVLAERVSASLVAAGK